MAVSLLRGRAIVAAVILSAGCDWQLSGRPDPDQRPLPPEQEKQFIPLYQRNCAGCHGSDGVLGPAPPLNDDVFLSIIPNAELKRVITDGREGTLMPAWVRSHGGPLSSEQVEVLATGIKKHWAGLPKFEKDIPPYLPDKKIVGDKDAGADVFRMACANCHGEQGRGGVKDGPGPINDPVFLSLISDQALRRIIITGRRDLGMPGYGFLAGRSHTFTPLTSKDVSDLVALLAYWRVGGSLNGK